MNKRTAGFAFMVLAGFLYTARFLTAAIYVSHMQSWGREWFLHAMQYVGSGLHVWAGAALIVGVVYLVTAETDERKPQNSGGGTGNEAREFTTCESSNRVLSDHKKRSSQTSVNFSMRGDL